MHLKVRIAALAMILLVASSVRPADAQDSPEAAIRAALTGWMDAFNAGHTDAVCDLFASNLISDYRGQPERGFAKQCEILKASLADPTKRYTYALTIKEILVFGEIAVARVVWTLTVRQTGTGRETKAIEPSLDVFRRDADGQWRIIRYLAYEEE